jgi:hypothetical protein
MVDLKVDRRRLPGERVRKILVDLAIPADLVNKPGRGYSLVFRTT